MDIRQEIVKQVDQLPPAMQEQVLRFVSSLTAAPIGEKGAALRQFSNSLDVISAQEMSQAIEREYEQVDTSQW
jgi:hypothetical protein